MQRDDATVLDILKAARRAQAFLGTLGLDDFLRDAKTQSSVLHQLLVLGEAVKRITDEFRAGHPANPRKRMAGLRDVLIHQYDDVDLAEVWNTLTRELPDLIAHLEPLAPSKPEGQR